MLRSHVPANCDLAIGLGCMVLVLLASTPAAGQAGDPAAPAAPTLRVVAIGVSEFADPSAEGPRYAKADAVAFHGALDGIPAERSRLLVDEQATGRAVRSALGSVLRKAAADDVVLVFLSGQGVADPDRMEDVYFLPYDVDPGQLAATALALGDIARALRRSPAARTILLADLSRTDRIQEARRRGIYPNVVNAALWEIASSAGAIVITASEGPQASLEGEQWGGGRGVFTEVLVEGLGGAADLDGDGVVRLGELAEYARERIRSETDGAQSLGVALTTFDGQIPLSLAPRSGPGT